MYIMSHNQARYSNLPIVTIKNKQGHSDKARSLRLHKFEIPLDFIWHTVTDGETIDYLAWKYYADEKLWWKIADANELAFPLQIEAGIRLRIPAPVEATRQSRQRSFE